MHTHMLKRLHIEMDLRQALERGEFKVCYQPIVSLRTGKISGLEAVLHWHHPQQGRMLPSDFLPVAEETGLVVPLGAWLRREACQQIALWQQRYPAYHDLTLHVNLSAVELNHPGIVAQIITTLQEATLSSEHLLLEITEGMILDPTSTVTAVFKELRRNKLYLYLDNFGIGYASLSHLPFVPIKGLKIDRTFITTMQHIEQNAMIVRAIAALAHNLNLELIAEGVETEEHLAELCALRCDYGQGHLFATPLDKHAVEKLLAHTPQWQVALPRNTHIPRLTAHELHGQN
jgi:EAL domain-containing protein (putative c-di-GMP-specific phosphodiesterase class I)